MISKSVNDSPIEKDKPMKKTWISLRVIEGEYETESDAADGMNAGYGENFNEEHLLCDRIIGFTPSEITFLSKRLLNQQIEEQS
jgi:hypothetical protein